MKDLIEIGIRTLKYFRWVMEVRFNKYCQSALCVYIVRFVSFSLHWNMKEGEDLWVECGNFSDHWLLERFALVFVVRLRGVANCAANIFLSFFIYNCTLRWPSHKSRTWRDSTSGTCSCSVPSQRSSSYCILGHSIELHSHPVPLRFYCKRDSSFLRLSNSPMNLISLTFYSSLTCPLQLPIGATPIGTFLQVDEIESCWYFVSLVFHLKTTALIHFHLSRFVVFLS